MFNNKQPAKLERLLQGYVEGQPLEPIPAEQEPEEKTTRKLVGYWLKWENVEREMREFMKGRTQPPTSEEISEYNQSLVQAICKRYGGIRRVRERLGYASGRQQRGYWQQWKNIESELNQIIEELGHFPTQNELREFGKNSLADAISKSHGGSHKVRAKMGYEGKRKPNAHWKDWDNVQTELEAISDQLGHFPTREDLDKLDKGDLAAGMARHHGGHTAVREKMGCEEGYKPKGYWADFENMRQEFTEVIETLGHFPTAEELRQLGKGSAIVAVRKYHGGFFSVREKMGISTAGERDNLENLLGSYVNGGGQDE